MRVTRARTCCSTLSGTLKWYISPDPALKNWYSTATPAATSTPSTSHLPLPSLPSTSGPAPPSRPNLLEGGRTTGTAGGDVQLRPYQEECVEECLEAIRNGVTRIGVSCPTEEVEQTIFTELLKRYSDALDATEGGGKKILIIVNTIQLVNQTYAHVKKTCPNKKVEIEQGSNLSSGEEDITIASSATMARTERLQNFDRENMGYYKAPELNRKQAHHAASASYRRTLAHFDPRIMPKKTTKMGKGIYQELEQLTSEEEEDVNPVPIVGFSATFSRNDGLALSSVFERIVFHKNLVEMVKEGWLSPVRFTLVEAALDLSNVIVSTTSGDFMPTSLSHVVNTDSVNKLVVRSWMEKAGNRRSSLVFGVTIDHVKALTQEFRLAGIDARYLYAETKARDRNKLLNDFRKGVFPVLVNCSILTEGADIPEVDCVVMARPTKSKNLFSQMIGRGLRLSPTSGKEDCLVLDIVKNSSRGVVCAPELFGFQPDVVEGKTTDEALLLDLVEKSMFKPRPVLPLPEEVSYVDYATIFDIIESTRSVDDETIWTIQRLTSVNWVGCGNKKFVLDLLGIGFITVQPSGLSDPTKSWKATFVKNYAVALRRGRTQGAFARPKLLGHSESLEHAILGGNHFAAGEMKGPNGMHRFGNLSRYAPWRRKEKISDGQKKFIKPRLGVSAKGSGEGKKEYIEGIWVGRSWKELVKIDNLTKGEAGDIITRFKHGAKSGWDKRKKGFLSEETKRTKKQSLRDDPLWRKLIEEGKVTYADINPLERE
ncbi:P-loop containing nucleoside triphosphate hydrolase protein [Atractiella rhizophila]|nr:P-loop containing nucleoside triphosphate hydrolase protein [Atractiella rhizophila]